MENVSRIKDMVRHARYIYNVAGIDTIGLGTDFDGIDDHLELNGAGDMQKRKVHCKTKLSAVILYLKENCSGRNRTISIMPDL